jgi:hypothetical protein
MQIEIVEKVTEYYIVAVEQEEYNNIFKLNDGAIGREPWKTIDAWCAQTFGEQGVWGAPPSSWKRMGPRYFFQSDEERTMFVLRWQQ